MPSPLRAAALAPAGVGLAMFVMAVQFRMDGVWSDGVLLVAVALPALALLALGLVAARADGSRGATTMMLVAGLVLAGCAIAWLGQVLAGDDPTAGGGTLTWMLALFTAIAAYSTARTRSAACLLIASLAGVALFLEAVNWIFDTENVDTFRALLAVSFAVLFLAGLIVSGRAGTILVGAAGVTVIVSSYLLGFAFILSPDGSQIGWGWELLVLLEGLALLAYAAVELEPGPAYLAFFVLVLFTIGATAGGGGALFGSEAFNQSQTLVGWPLALGIGTGLAALWGMRQPASG